MSNQGLPRISVGLPVYNGEPFLVQALEALLSQTFADFELIICDNASTDRTEAICREYAARDPRIRYLRHPRNIGVNRNFNHCVEEARAPYFRWAASDDLCAPTLLEKLVAVLDARPDVVLAYPGSREIDEIGRTVRDYSDGLTLEQDAPNRRFATCLWKVYWCNPLFGLFRTDVLRRTGLFVNYSNSDIVLLCEVPLHGKVVEVPETLFYRRVHSGMTVRKFKSAHERMAMGNPELAGKLTFPNTRFFAGFFAAVRRSRLPWRERMKCYARLHICWRRWRERLWEDARYAALYVVGRT